MQIKIDRKVPYKATNGQFASCVIKLYPAFALFTVALNQSRQTSNQYSAHYSAKMFKPNSLPK